jgi:hypothetical protein
MRGSKGDPRWRKWRGRSGIGRTRRKGGTFYKRRAEQGCSVLRSEGKGGKEGGPDRDEGARETSCRATWQGHDRGSTTRCTWLGAIPEGCGRVRGVGDRRRCVFADVAVREGPGHRGAAAWHQCDVACWREFSAPEL